MHIVADNLRLLAVSAFMALLAGCAFGTRQPTLIYPPAPESDATPVAHAATMAASKNVEITLNPFNDRRADQKVVGTVRNGFGMRTADVISTNQVDDWVTQALKTELQNNGYSVHITSGDDSSKAANAVVSGEVLKAFCDMYFNYNAEVSLLIKVSRDGKEILNKNYTGEGSAGVVVSATEKSFGQSLALALAAALKPFVVDLDKALSTP